MIQTEVLTSVPFVLRLSQEQKIRFFLKDVKKLTKDEKILKIIKEWKKEFFSEFKVNSLDEEERIRTAHALLSFRHTIEYIMETFMESDREKIIWLPPYNDMKELVFSFLPPKINFEKFIEEDRIKFFEYCIQSRIHSIKELLKQTSKRDFREIFEEVKEMLLNLYEEKDKTSEELHQEIDNLTKDVKEVYEWLEKQLLTLKATGENLIDNEKMTLTSLNDLENILNKV